MGPATYAASTMTIVRWALAPLLAAVVALVMLTPVATADITAYDSQFLNALAQGQWDFSVPENGVRLGHDVCNEISMSGWTPRQATNAGNWWVVPPGSPAALYFVKTAIKFYCPQYLSDVDW